MPPRCNDSPTLSKLARKAIQSPETADANYLLLLADDCLTNVRGDTDFIRAIRRVAFAACDWSVFQTEDDRLRLRNALLTAEMIYRPHQRISPLDLG